MSAHSSFFSIDNSFETMSGLIFLALPIMVLSLIFLYIGMKERGKPVQTSLVFPIIGMLLFNFLYHNGVDLIMKKDYSRFKEGSILGFMGAIVGVLISMFMSSKGIVSSTQMV